MITSTVAILSPADLHAEWQREFGEEVREGETQAVRDYYLVEVEGGGRNWIFRRGDDVDRATGDLSWWMHGTFG